MQQLTILSPFLCHIQFFLLLLWPLLLSLKSISPSTTNNKKKLLPSFCFMFYPCLSLLYCIPSTSQSIATQTKSTFILTSEIKKKCHTHVHGKTPKSNIFQLLMGRGVENEEFVCCYNKATTALMSCRLYRMACAGARVFMPLLLQTFYIYMNDVAIMVWNDSKINKNHVTYRFSPILKLTQRCAGFFSLSLSLFIVACVCCQMSIDRAFQICGLDFHNSAQLLVIT